MIRCHLLCYHWFRADGAEARGARADLEIEASRFGRQLDLLSESGFGTIHLADLLDPPPAGLPARPVVICVDDGSACFARFALPELERRGLCATLFAVAGKLGGRADWDPGEPPRKLLERGQLVELQSAGCEIGSHGMTHRDLRTLGDAALRDELVRSRDLLGEALGRPPGFLAYPYGACDARSKAFAAAAGYRGACAVALDAPDLLCSQRFCLMRIYVMATEPLLGFALRLLAAGWIRHEVS
ncbi:MAG: polysaccharide deacetylase family protein [Deltaproteobacteria bacterium]|nr:polysaccharide deacetylase family protein [Deltaproteobacteria bacterium]